MSKSIITRPRGQRINGFDVASGRKTSSYPSSSKLTQAKKPKAEEQPSSAPSKVQLEDTKELIFSKSGIIGTCAQDCKCLVIGYDSLTPEQVQSARSVCQGGKAELYDQQGTKQGFVHLNIAAPAAPLAASVDPKETENKSGKKNGDPLSRGQVILLLLFYIVILLVLFYLIFFLAKVIYKKVPHFKGSRLAPAAGYAPGYAPALYPPMSY
jgi:hypothetical protein